MLILHYLLFVQYATTLYGYITNVINKQFINVIVAMTSALSISIFNELSPNLRSKISFKYPLDVYKKCDKFSAMK